MASKPGILTDWPWKPLGSFKFVILAPWAIHSSYLYFKGEEHERDLSYFLIFPFLVLRMLHNQIWISLSRYQTAKGNKRIVDKPIEFEQVDRERPWDDQILFNGLLWYVGRMGLTRGRNLPFWRSDGVVMTALLHAGPVEFLYYWFHRALHHHFLYSRYHSHHHSSIVTEPISSVTHPFAEHIVYFLLFAIPLVVTVLTETASIASFSLYVMFIDFMNNMGHCNFELVPKRLFSVFPPLKFLIYTPSYHSLHHTQFRSNFSLFMPIYDYMYGTVDKCSESLYESSLLRAEEVPQVVHLTHLTTPESIYHIRLGLASVASQPLAADQGLRLLWPLTFCSVLASCFYGETFVSERNTFKALKLQSWVLPRFNLQYLMKWRREAINNLIEAAILDADKKGVKALSLGLLNQGKELNEYGEIYIKRHPKLKLKLVDGSSLAAAIVVNTIPKGTTQVLLRGNLSKVAYAIADALCQMGFQVATLYENEHKKLKSKITTNSNNLVLAKITTHKIWIVGDGLEEFEQQNAPKGTIFIPFSQFPPKRLRKDCYYHITPSMKVPSSFENVDSCENWLPRRVMSAWRMAGILHALERRETHECGETMLSLEDAWRASLQNGFLPLEIPSSSF
ncbi:protein ECERIFERUM 1-like isoform X2 [Momordica charantia]|uniref:Protein ECERIFERUM 1-like isoform X2 n=1 Tax=Momordica charantia TaxID=3673 RepID=A0A6J1DR41_MOMCH|nr:protein ECERIFERUM 1-like isoform X2 [Momordica charantia]